MATLKLNSYELFSQSSNNRPVYGSGVPTGTIVQQVIKNEMIGDGTAANAHEYVPTSNTGTFTSVFWNLSITTTLTNSKIQLFAQSPYVYIQSGTGGEFWFTRNPSSDNIDVNRSGAGSGYVVYTADSGGAFRQMNAYDTPNVVAGTVLNYVVKYRRWYGSAEVYWVYDRGGSFGIFTITEIAA